MRCDYRCEKTEMIGQDCKTCPGNFKPCSEGVDMKFEQAKEKADSFFEFLTGNKDHVTTTSAILFAMECAKEVENSPWLTLAHMICTDQGIPHGHIEWRLQVLQGLLAESI